MEYIKEHKLGFFTGGCILLCILLLAFTFYQLFFSQKSNSKYGDRLDGINEIAIKDNALDGLKSNIKKEPKVNEVTTNVEGRILNVTIDVDSTLKVATAKKLTTKITEKLTNEQLTYFDVQVFIICSSDDKNKTYPVIGYRHKTNKSFIWNNN